MIKFLNPFKAHLVILGLIGVFTSFAQAGQQQPQLYVGRGDNAKCLEMQMRGNLDEKGNLSYRLRITDGTRCGLRKPNLTKLNLESATGELSVGSEDGKVVVGTMLLRKNRGKMCYTLEFNKNIDDVSGVVLNADGSAHWFCPQ